MDPINEAIRILRLTDKEYEKELAMSTTTQETRPLYEIANEIRHTWSNVWFGAVPYLDAMEALESIDDQYRAESGESIVLYFLANAQTWRGPDARRIKAELKALSPITSRRR